MGRLYETAIRVAAAIDRSLRTDALGAAGALTKLTGATKKLYTAERAAASYKSLTAAVSSSKAKYDQAATSLRALEAAERAAGGATKESTAWRRAGEKELARYAKEMDRATAAAGKNAAAMQHLPRLRFEAAREHILGERKEKSQVPLVDKAAGQVRSLARDAMILGTAATGAAGALAGLAVKSIHAGDEIGDTAAKLGIGTTALQELRYGAESSGAETAELDKALGKMLITVGKFKSAKGKAGGGGALSVAGMQMLGAGGASSSAGDADPFKKIGLNAKALAKLSPEDQLKRIADGLGTLKTKADRAAVGAAIFGKTFLQLDPFMQEGAAGIEKLSKAAHKYGGIMSPEDIRNADAADQALRDAKMAIFGVTNTLGSALLPTATKVLTKFSGWVAENRGQLQKWATTAATWIEGKGVPALLELGRAAKSLATTVVGLVDKFGAGNTVLLATGLRLAPLAKTVWDINSALFKATRAWGDFSKAAQGAEGLEGPTKMGRALGAAASVMMLAEAASVGYAIGTAIDKAVGASDWAAKLIGKTTGQGEKLSEIERLGVEAHRSKLTIKDAERQGLVQDYIGRGLSKGQALYAADQHLRLPQSGSGAVQVSPTIQVNIEGGSREDIEKQIFAAMRKAAGRVVDDVANARAAQERRLSFAE